MTKTVITRKETQLGLKVDRKKKENVLREGIVKNITTGR